ncbi:MAG: PDZ domain-containing protein [Candidatus Eiseniibacteriota bacterium]
MRPKRQLTGVLLTALVLAASGTAGIGNAAAAETKSTVTKTTQSKSTETKTSESQRPWLGVVTQALDDDLRDGLDYHGQGVLVNRVADLSPAAKAGVHQGDVIVSMNGKTVNDPDELQDLVRSARIGERASLAVVRDGKQQTLSASLVERPSEMSWGDDQHRIVIHESRGMQFDLDHMPDLPELPQVGRGRLGVELQDLNSDLGGYFSVPDGKGALIVSVVDGSAAAQAGLKSGDVIVKIGDQAVEDADDAARAIRQGSGATPVEVMRKGKRMTLTATLESRRRTNSFFLGRVDDDGMPGMGDNDVHRMNSELRRQMDDLRREIRQLSEQLKQKSQN